MRGIGMTGLILLAIVMTVAGMALNDWSTAVSIGFRNEVAYYLSFAMVLGAGIIAGAVLVR